MMLCVLALALNSVATANPSPAACGAAAIPIADVQGAGPLSPRVGETVVVEAVVTAAYPALKGFYLMTPDDEQDQDPATSEAVFVYSPGTTATAGERWRVAGRVEEFHGLTRIKADARRRCGRGDTVTPVALTLPFDSVDDLEAREGMLVKVAQALTVTDNHELGRYGSVTLSLGRLFAPTQIAAPGAGARRLSQANRRNRIVLDDGAHAVNPRPLPGPPPRAGDQTAPFRAILSYAFDQWRLQPVGELRWRAANPRPRAPERVGDDHLRVAAFNLLNYFNGDGRGGGFPTPRGASDSQALERQQAKLVAAIQALDADVVGLTEIENDGYGTDSAIAQLSRTLGEHWRYVDPGTRRLGDDAIAVGLLYRGDRVVEAGTAATTAQGAFGDGGHRQPLAQTFRRRDGGITVTVTVNHFKSKAGCPVKGSGRDRGDGQGCWNTQRVMAAQSLLRWLREDPTGSGHDRTLVIGDLNSYAREEPITVLRDAGLVNLVRRFQGERAYGYSYRGEAGYLDHALATPTLAQRVVAVRHWPINADEAPLFGYREPRFHAADPYRSSDHDPLLVDLSVAAAD